MRLPRWLLEAKDKQPSQKALMVSTRISYKLLQRSPSVKDEAYKLAQTNLDRAERGKNLKRVSEIKYEENRATALKGLLIYATADYYGYWTHLTRLGRWWWRRREEQRESDWEREQMEQEGLEAAG